MEFCQKIRAGGNHLVVATAGGHQLAVDKRLKLRERELAAVIKEFRELPESARKPQLAKDNDAVPPRRILPKPPQGGLIVRGFCTYLQRDGDKIARAKQYYYKENPDRWAAETQSDMLWLTESEWKSLVPANPKLGDRAEVAAPIQKRFFSTLAIDYMEGSVNSLPPRDMKLSLTVEQVADDGITLRLDGYGWMGKELDEKLRSEARSRGCEIRVLGRLHYNTKTEKLDRFDLVGVGDAWGNKMNYIGREIRLENYPWSYGIACELVQGDSPIDLIPPYNLLHYGSAGPYFEKH